MKPYCYCLLSIFFFTIAISASAQQIFTISGRVTDSVGTPQKAATVFISGTTRITISDEKGEFTFDRMPPGTFQLSVSMVGFNPYAHNVVIQNSSVKADVLLKTKTMILREVVIGPNRQAENLALFKKAFIGATANAKTCTLLNPDAVNFSFKKSTGILTADADEFLLLENKNLGYRIKYLLKYFSYDTRLGIALYDGETSFEELPGTDKQKRTWAKNRLETYQGSMMHFLRSVYHSNTTAEGFAGHNLIRLVPDLSYRDASHFKMYTDAVTVNFESLKLPADSPLIALKFQNLYIEYTGKKLTGLKAEKEEGAKQLVTPGKCSSVIRLVEPQAIIDGRGSCIDYRTFYVMGYMADKRIGEQLPFEYQPQAKN